MPLPHVLLPSLPRSARKGHGQPLRFKWGLGKGQADIWTGGRGLQPTFRGSLNQALTWTQIWQRSCWSQGPW